jgi:hypothetical protein
LNFEPFKNNPIKFNFRCITANQIIPFKITVTQIDAIWQSLDACGGDKVATSTPNGPTLAIETRQPRRKSRRSWFDKPSTKYEIAVERNRRSKGRKKSDVEDEILMLTHFTNPPKISFGNLKPGVHKTRTLIIRNPHDYEQTVKVEKFPHKKKISVEHHYNFLLWWSFYRTKNKSLQPVRIVNNKQNHLSKHSFIFWFPMDFEQKRSFCFNSKF